MEESTPNSNILPQKHLKQESTIPSQPLLRNTTAYMDRNEEYLSNGMNQYTIQFLRKVAESNKCIKLFTLGAEYSLANMFSSILYICKLLHMNELEITLWSLCLESANKKDNDLSVVLLVTAYQAKVKLKK
jgi:hypothetical protein